MDELRTRFEQELRVAGLDVPDGDREGLFAMWADFLPQRDALRDATLRPDEDPTFLQKPTHAEDRSA
jgi:hypothetical protein